MSQISWRDNARDSGSAAAPVPVVIGTPRFVPSCEDGLPLALTSGTVGERKIAPAGTPVRNMSGRPLSVTGGPLVPTSDRTTWLDQNDHGFVENPRRYARCSRPSTRVRSFMLQPHIQSNSYANFGYWCVQTSVICVGRITVRGLYGD